MKPPLCWHKWGKWSEVIQCFNGSNHQVCKCTKCGAITHRRVVSIFLKQLQAIVINNAIGKIND